MFLEASIAITFAKSHSVINEMLTPMVLVCLNKKVLTLGVMGTYPTPPPSPIHMSFIWCQCEPYNKIMPCPKTHTHTQKSILVFFFKFVNQVNWQSCPKGLSQIWLKVRRVGKKHQVFSYYLEAHWKLSSNYGELRFFFRCNLMTSVYFFQKHPFVFSAHGFFLFCQVAKKFKKKTTLPYRIQCLIVFKIGVKMAILHKKMQK